MVTQVSRDPQFWLGGGHTIVDLANTAYDGTESFHTFGNVVAWLKRSGLEQRRIPGRSPKDESAALIGVRRLRESARAILEAALSNERAPRQAVEHINAALSGGVPSLLKSGERYVLDVTSDLARPQDVLIPIARALASFLTDADPTRVKRCPSCSMYIYDASKNRTRSWCSMKACGNRAKVAAHYRRTKNHI